MGKGRRSNSKGAKQAGKRSSVGATESEKPPTAPAPCAADRDDDRFLTLASRFRAVLIYYSVPADQRDSFLEEEELSGFREMLRCQVGSMRQQLYKLVFDYSAALEMISWACPARQSRAMQEQIWGDSDPGASTACGTNESTTGTGGDVWPDIDPWNEFAEAEIEKGALWIHLLVDAWDQWDAVPRPKSWDDLPGSVWWHLIRIFEPVAEDLAKEDPDLGLELQFQRARDSAWKAVVRETLKWLEVSRKPDAVGLSAAQRNRDASVVQRLTKMSQQAESAQRNRDASVVQRLTKTRRQVKSALRNLQGALANLARRWAERDGVAFDDSRKALSDRIKKIPERWSEPHPALTTAVRWTSADLPLCLMSTEAAATAVYEIHFVDPPAELEYLPEKEAFPQSFRMILQRDELNPFLLRRKRGKSQSRLAGIVEELSVERADCPLSGEDGPSDGGSSAGVEKKGPPVAIVLKISQAYLPPGTVAMELRRLIDGVELSGGAAPERICNPSD